MSLFRRRIGPDSPLSAAPAPMDRVTSVLGPETIVKGRLSGSGGVRLEGSFEGEISLDGLLVIGENGKVTSDNITATVVVIAGIVKGNIIAEKVEIRSTGRVWGDVTTSAFATQEGAFLRGQVQMEEQLELEFMDEADEISFEVEETEPPDGQSAALEAARSPEEPGEETPEASGEEAEPEPAASSDPEDENQASAAIADQSIEAAAEPDTAEKPKRGRKRTQKKETAAE